MVAQDIALGMRLKAAANWNQTAADWRMLLDAGTGLVASWDGVACGTVTVVPYGPFAWIGMLLVDPAFRGRGIGTALLEAAIAVVPEGVAACLDATPQGEPLYLRRGFAKEYGLARFRRAAAPWRGDAAGGGGIVCQSVSPAVLPELAQYDLPIFGGDRGGLLRELWRRAPQVAYLARRDDQLVGYCLGRSGSHCEQLGPVIAEDATVARALLAAALQRCFHRDVILDATESHAAWLGMVEGAGFEWQRPFCRMCLGGDSTFGPPSRQFAIAGPELG